MNKTPIQEAMDWVWKQRESTTDHNAIQAFDAVWSRLNELLEKEKEQIERVFLDGWCCVPNFDLTSEEYWERGSTYYKETFKQRELTLRHGKP